MRFPDLPDKTLPALPLAFEVVRHAGACYLIYLGISMILKRRASVIGLTGESRSRPNFLQGVTTEVLNPKTALFFLSFIPQFVSSAKGHVVLQFLIFGTISVILNTAADLLVVGFAGSLALRLSWSALDPEANARFEGPE